MKKKNNQFSKLIHQSTFVAILSFILIIAMYFLGIFDFLENKSFDHRTKKTASFVKASEDIILIAINQDCIEEAKEKYGWSWPWPREAYGKIVEFISAGDVNSIVFDILFTEDSVYGTLDDERFGSAIKKSGKVINTMYVKSQNQDVYEVLNPIPAVLQASAIIGNSTSIKDKDDVIRKARVFTDINGQKVPSMGIASLLVNGDKLKPLPLQKDGSVILRYQDSIKNYTFRYATDILESYDAWKNGEEGIYVPEDFDKAYVFLALYGPGLFDICATPVSQVYPGVGVHITQLDNYLNDCYIQKIPVILVIFWFVLMGFLGAYAVVLGQTRNSQWKIILIMISGVIAGAIICVLLPYLLFRYGWWLPLVGPLAELLLSFIVTLGLVYTIEGKQRRFIRTAFSQCLAKEIVRQIEEHPETFKLGGERFQMTAIFSDIQKFSSFSELLTAAQLVALLNYYLTKMSDVIIEEGGTIDKYEGDAIVAFVGAPLSMEDHAQRAVSAAIKMKQLEKEMNEEIKIIAATEKNESMNEELYTAFKIMTENQKNLFTRIGINSGEMIAGYMGSENKKNYTIMGNNVNLASRLEGVNKQYSTSGILISEATRNLLNDNFIVRRLDRVRVVNVNTPIRLYEPLALKSDDDKYADLCSDVNLWESVMDKFECGDYSEALAGFKSFLDKNNDDKVALYYINLIEKYFIRGKYPQEQDGEGVAFIPEDGVFKLLQK